MSTVVASRHGSVSETPRSPAASPRLGQFVVLAFGLSWLGIFIEGLSIAEVGPIATPFNLGIVSQFGPSLVAVYLVWRSAGSAGLGRFLSGLRPRRSHLKPLAPVLAAVGLVALVILVYLAFGGVRPDFELFPGWTLPLVLLASIALGCVFGGLSEELGWRGIALPLLQRRTTALAASLLLAAIWTAWHVEPGSVATLFTDGPSAFASEVGLDWAGRLLYTIPSTILITSVYNRAGADLFAAVAAHGIYNGIATTALAMWTDMPLALEVGWVAVWTLLAGWALRRFGPDDLNDDGPRAVTVAG